MSSCFGCCDYDHAHEKKHRPLQPRNQELLVLGLQGAGKSLLMRQLCNLANKVDRPLPQLQPTVGVELYSVKIHSKFQSHAVKAREVGGCMLPVWPQYYDGAHALIYVMDITMIEMLAESIVELHNTLQHPSMQDKAVCLLLHQQLPKKDKMSPGVLDHVLGIDSLHDMYPGPLTVVSLSDTEGASLHPLLKWLEQQTGL